MGWEWKIIKNCPQNYQIIEYIWILFGSFPKNWRKEWGNPKKCQFLGFAKFALIISRNNISHHVVRNSHFAKFLSIVVLNRKFKILFFLVFLGEFPDALHESSASLGPTQLLIVLLLVNILHVLWNDILLSVTPSELNGNELTSAQVISNILQDKN